MHRDLVVVGASAGGIEALQVLVRGLPRDLRAAVLVVLHTSVRARSLLPQILGRAGSLPAEHPTDGTPIEYARLYIAPPDFHMLVEGNVIRVLRGPRENLHRPAIDPLLRSAALTGGRRAIGVVLTGLMDDGTSGLMVVRGRGGEAIVQDPDTATFAAMPQNALDHVPDARVLPLEEIAGEIVRLTREELPDEKPEAAGAHDFVETAETRLLEQQLPQIEDGDRPGQPSSFACPDCGGVLWEIEQQGLLRFRCRVGHAFTAQYLGAEQEHAVETALWSALRALEESAALYQRMAERAVRGRQPHSAARFQDRAADKDAHAKVLREFLVRVSETAGR